MSRVLRSQSGRWPRAIEAVLIMTALAGTLSPTAHGAMQTLSGSSFDLTYDDALLGLWGAPSLSGTTIFFTPTSFLAQSTNGSPPTGGVVATTSTINLTLTAKPGFSFGTLALTERGDYVLNGAGSSVSVGGQLIAFDQSNPINSYSASFINPSPTTPLTTNNNSLQPWQAGASLAVGLPPFFDPTVLRVTLQNQLIATTTPAGGAGSLAFIQKKFAGAPVTLEVLPLPEPGAMLLVSIGLVPLLGVLKRGV